MGRIQKILVPVDGSVNGCKAVDEAIFFAEKCKADLDFVYVASNINKDIPSHIVFDRIWEKLPDDIKASKHVETGNIPKAIMRVAAEEHSDLIIMGSRGLGLFKGVQQQKLAGGRLLRKKGTAVRTAVPFFLFCSLCGIIRAGILCTSSMVRSFLCV